MNLRGDLIMKRSFTLLFVVIAMLLAFSFTGYPNKK